ncbi:hypothetical protein IMCC9480_259 [Oxalobacteraceae bacterium IMCC9480]|nr:hypothetical protein IMCC9480_259 [Oxalobacteraceae bacterium IMCC9480]
MEYAVVCATDLFQCAMFSMRPPPTPMPRHRLIATRADGAVRLVEQPFF